MPKHVPTFKHLLHTSHSYRPQADQPKETPPRRRRGQEQVIPPYVWGQNVWSANTTGGVDVSLLLDLENADVHPAELLRRFEHSRWVASRTTAGPAAPPSWHAARQISARQKQTSTNTSIKTLEYPPVTSEQLVEASLLLSQPPHNRAKPVAKLSDFCFDVVLRHIDDSEIIYMPDQAGPDFDPERPDSGVYTLGKVLREQVTYLEPHLKVALMDAYSLSSQASSRITDESFRAILSDDAWEAEGRGDSNEEDWDDWDSPETVVTNRLSLVLHHSPQTILQQLPFTLSLTTINLAYSTLPNLNDLVGALPPGLRELGMVGVNMGRQEEATIRKGLLNLARKLAVLQILDLSFPRFQLSANLLTAIFENNFSQLQTLGLRGVLDQLLLSTPTLSGSLEDGEEIRRETEHTVEKAIRGTDRIRYLDVVWESDSWMGYR